jgi:hypothetical protein
LQQHFQHASVGNGRLAEDLYVSDLTRHDRLFHAFSFKEPNQLAKLADTDPRQSVDTALNLRIRFFANGGDRQGNTGPTRSFDHHERKTAVAGD